MSRALDLLRRLDHVGEPDISEDDDDMMGDQGGEGEGEEGDEETPAPGMPQQQQQTPVTEPNSPFSKDLRNPDGSMKVGDTDQNINDKKRGASTPVKESRYTRHQRTYARRK